MGRLLCFWQRFGVSARGGWSSAALRSGTSVRLYGAAPVEFIRFVGQAFAASRQVLSFVFLAVERGNWRLPESHRPR